MDVILAVALMMIFFWLGFLFNVWLSQQRPEPEPDHCIVYRAGMFYVERCDAWWLVVKETPDGPELYNECALFASAKHEVDELAKDDRYEDQGHH